MIGRPSTRIPVSSGSLWAVILAVVVLWAPTTVSLDWHIEVVDSVGNVGEYNSLALDGNGHPHISYCDATNWDLRYAHKDGSGWHIDTVDTAGGYYASLALDGSGYPHISYEAGGLKYAYRDTSGWHIETPVPAAGWCTSVALDGSSFPHISYLESDGFLNCAHKDSSGWRADTVAHPPIFGWLWHTSLALDADGICHIGYTQYGSLPGQEGVNHAWEDTSGWQTEYVDGGMEPSLVVDASGWPHMSYCGTDWWSFPVCIRYAREDSSGWHKETAESTGFFWGAWFGWPSLALDGSEYPHISYNYHDKGLSYAYRDASGWHHETIDSAGGSGSLALDGDGHPHISYYDGTNGDLKYARGTMGLSGSVEAGQLVLTWTPWRGTSQYWVYGADNIAYFEPGFAPGYQHRLAVLLPLLQTWSSANGVGNPGHNWTYMVLAVDASEQELCRSNRFGEFDFSVDTSP